MDVSDEGCDAMKKPDGNRPDANEVEGQEPEERSRLPAVEGREAAEARDRLLVQMREANEKLLVATVRAEQAADEANAARAEAETTRAQLEESQRALVLANRRKDEFLAMLGHELRNPLAPILTALQLMKLRGDRSSVPERAVIERQVAHMVQLIDDLLDLSRITSGKVELHKRTVELSAVIAKAVEIASPLLERRSHALSVSVAPTGLRVGADLVRLAQVVANLLTNAAKFTEPHGRITLTAARENGSIRVSVRDNGIGIPAEVLPTIFEPFVQGQRTTERAQGGLGLGLAIVRSLVDLHGGTLSVHSEGRGKGSEFSVCLRAVDAASAAESVVEEPRRKRARGASPGIRILVVDDNVDAAETMAEALRYFGHEVASAHDGPEALKEVTRFEPQAVVMDIGLPVMDGYELARRLRERERDQGSGERLRLVAVTGYGQDTDRRRSAEAGIDVHLVKPVDVDGLAAALVAQRADLGEQR